jgi:hypothetical protein
MGLWTAFTRNVAETRPDAPHPRLRGRAYPVTFARVWSAALETARAMPRWTVTEEAAGAGTIRAEARTPAVELHRRRGHPHLVGRQGDDARGPPLVIARGARRFRDERAPGRPLLARA